MIRQTLLVPILLCGLLGLGACQPPPAEIKIGVLAILSGSDREASGIPTVNTAQLAVKQVNDAGGLEVGGRKYKITLVIADDGNTPESAVAAAKKLINQEGVVALVGPQYSSNAIPVSEIAEAARIPMISPASTNPKTTLGKQYVFRVGFIDDFQGQVVAQFTFDDLGAHKAAVLYDIASDYNRGIAEIFKQVFTAKGGQVVAFESYTTGEKDYGKQLQHIQASGAQALFLPNYPEDVIAQVQQARQMGLGAICLGSDGWDPRQMITLPEFDNSFYSGHWHYSSTSPESQAFLKAYMTEYKITDPSTLIDTMSLTYDAFGMLFYAMQSQGKVDPDSIRAGLAAIKGYRGVTGLIEYRGTGDPIKSAVMMQLKDGKINFYKTVNP
jgi:branched-chain amino acid transport system substrate-binding protein